MLILPEGSHVSHLCAFYHPVFCLKCSHQIILLVKYTSNPAHLKSYLTHRIWFLGMEVTFPPLDTYSTLFSSQDDYFLHCVMTIDVCVLESFPNLSQGQALYLGGIKGRLGPGGLEQLQRCSITFIKWKILLFFSALWFHLYAKPQRAYCWCITSENLILICCHKFQLCIYYAFTGFPFCNLIKKNQFISYSL